MENIYITEREAAERYNLSTYWFQRSRWAGNGPAFVKLPGKVLYPVKETDEWFSSRLIKSTSEFTSS